MSEKKKTEEFVVGRLRLVGLVSGEATSPDVHIEVAGSVHKFKAELAEAGQAARLLFQRVRVTVRDEGSIGWWVVRVQAEVDAAPAPSGAA